jgi:hypothetical protein
VGGAARRRPERPPASRTSRDAPWTLLVGDCLDLLATLKRRCFVGIKREPEYATIARARIAHWSHAAEAEPGG